MDSNCDRRERTLYVWMLERNVTDDQLYELFTKMGPIEKLIFKKHFDGTPQHALIVFRYVDSVLSAMHSLQGSILNGKPLCIRPLRESMHAAVLPASGSASSYKSPPSNRKKSDVSQSSSTSSLSSTTVASKPRWEEQKHSKWEEHSSGSSTTSGGSTPTACTADGKRGNGSFSTSPPLAHSLSPPSRQSAYATLPRKQPWRPSRGTIPSPLMVRPMEHGQQPPVTSPMHHLPSPYSCVGQSHAGFHPGSAAGFGAMGPNGLPCYPGTVGRSIAMQRPALSPGMFSPNHQVPTHVPQSPLPHHPPVPQHWQQQQRQFAHPSPPPRRVHLPSLLDSMSIAQESRNETAARAQRTSTMNAYQPWNQNGGIASNSVVHGVFQQQLMPQPSPPLPPLPPMPSPMHSPTMMSPFMVQPPQSPPIGQFNNCPMFSFPPPQTPSHAQGAVFQTHPFLPLPLPTPLSFMAARPALGGCTPKTQQQQQQAMRALFGCRF